jgi:glycosyltransferase involved in cell wall biosynthesis
MSPDVSVLMATYNRSGIVERSIESVLGQTYESLELVVVDDGSDDETPAVVQSIEDDRIRYVRHDTNRGFAAALDTAARQAEGEYLAVIGDDDRWSDDRKLTRQLAALRNRDGHLGIVCTGFRVLSTDGSRVERTVRPEPPEDLERHILKRNGIISSSTVLVPRAVWESVGGVDTDVQRGVDSDIFRRIIFDGYEVVFLRTVAVDVYVGSSDRMTAKESTDQIRPHIESELRKLDKYPDRYQKYPGSESYVLQMVGLHHMRIWWLTRDPGHIDSAARYFRRSVRLDPTNLSAIAGAVVSSMLMAAYGVLASVRPSSGDAA